MQEAEAYTTQIHAIEQRAEMIRRSFLLVLISLAGTIASCLLLGVGFTGKTPQWWPSFYLFWL